MEKNRPSPFLVLIVRLVRQAKCKVRRTREVLYSAMRTATFAATFLCLLLSAREAASFTPTFVTIEASGRGRRGRGVIFASPGPPGAPSGPYGTGRLQLDTEEAVGAKALYDMVLVERIQKPKELDSGLVMPDDKQPKLHVARVLSVGPGREEENGRRTPIEGIEEGMLVVVKNPWGIGPKDEETGDGRMLSYVRHADVACVLNGKVLG